MAVEQLVVIVGRLGESSTDVQGGGGGRADRPQGRDPGAGETRPQRSHASAVALCADEQVKPDFEAHTVKTPSSGKPLSRLENSAEKASTSTGAKRVTQKRAPAKATAPRFVSGHREGKQVYS